jgi:hypothetical protein
LASDASRGGKKYGERLDAAVEAEMVELVRLEHGELIQRSVR